jgi:hypothetical protein
MGFLDGDGCSRTSIAGRARMGRSRLDLRRSTATMTHARTIRLGGAFVATETHTKRLSVIVPCYKTERFLPSCLDSLLSQDFDGLEIIGVNDGSPDGCLDILRDYERRHPDIVRVVDKENEGTWKARWAGVRAARGEYVGFIDSDDTACPDYMQSLCSAADESSAAVTVCGYRRVDLASGKTISRELTQRREPFRVKDDPGMIVGINTAVWNKLYRKDLLDSIEVIRDSPKALEDVVFCMLVYLAVFQTGSTVSFIPDCLVNYTVRDNSTITSVRGDTLEEDRRSLVEARTAFVDGGASSDLLAAQDAMVFLHLGISMSFRQSYDKDVDLKAVIMDTTSFLDDHFPTWSDSPYITGAYAKTHGSAFKKLLLASRAWKAHAMPAFLSVYKFMIGTLGIDIKW